MSVGPILNPLPQPPRPTLNPLPEPQLPPRPTVNPLPQPRPRPTVNPMPDTFSTRPTVNPLPQPQKIAFATFRPTSIRMYRDGGTIKMEGMLNRSVNASVRMDGAMSSKTRGTFYVSSHLWNRPEGSERPASVEELRELRKALRKYLKESGDSSPEYTQLLSRLAAAIKANNFQPKLKHPATVG